MAQLQPHHADTPRISASDLKQLTSEPSSKIRAQLCDKICATFNDQAYSPREAELAIEIIRLLVRDTSIRVRRTISERLSRNADVPHDIILHLANDEDVIAQAVLSESPVLREEDLLAIIHSTHNLKKLLAIAGRDSLSETVCSALIDNGEHSAVMKVLANPGAQLSDAMFDELLEEYYQDDSILEVMVQRGGLPYSVAQRLFYLVGEHYRQQLSESYHLREESIEDMVNYASENSMLRFLSPWMGQQDIQQLVQELFRDDKLTDSLVIRSLCIGDLRFFWTAMAKRADISVSNAKVLLLDPHQNGFDACYARAGMPASLRDALRVLYFCALEETQLGRFYHDQFISRVIARIAKEGYDETVEQMKTVIGMLNFSLQEMQHHARHNITTH